MRNCCISEVPSRRDLCVAVAGRCKVAVAEISISSRQKGLRSVHSPCRLSAHRKEPTLWEGVEMKSLTKNKCIQQCTPSPPTRVGAIIATFHNSTSSDDEENGRACRAGEQCVLCRAMFPIGCGARRETPHARLRSSPHRTFALREESSVEPTTCDRTAYLRAFNRNQRRSN